MKQEKKNEKKHVIYDVIRSPLNGQCLICNIIYGATVEHCNHQ